MDRLTTVTHIHERGTRAFMATGRTDSERVFRAAVRHSRHVRLLRVAIPLGVVLAAFASLVVATWLDPLRALAKLPVNIGGLVVSGTKIAMQQPHIAGFTRDGRPYTIVAREAAQDVTKPDTLELRDLQATMEMENKGVVEVSARTGIYDAKTEKLVLRQDVVVTTTEYQVYFNEAVINVRAGHIVSDKPVEVKMMQGTIRANRAEVLDSGAIIRFESGVEMDLSMDGGIALSGSGARQR